MMDIEQIKQSLEGSSLTYETHNKNFVLLNITTPALQPYSFLNAISTIEDITGLAFVSYIPPKGLMFRYKKTSYRITAREAQDIVGRNIEVKVGN